MTTLKHLSGKLWALLFSLLTGCYAWGQIPQAPQALPGPNTAGLGVYGDVPVSLFTGIPQIEIPLYELKEGEHTLPLSLSYYAGGVRPDQHPGWVGLNWSLNAGGVITRVIKDMPDEYNNSYFVHGKESGYYFTHELLNTANWSSKDYLVQVAQHPEIYVNDTEPDVFSFSFLDYSGKFMLTHDGQWKVQCDKPVKVEFDNTFLAIPSDVNMGYVPVHGNFKSFGGFTLTAEDGTQYVFGGTTSAIEYSVAFFAQTRDEWKAVSWYLTKIVYPDGDEITFKYSRDELTCQMYISVYQDKSFTFVLKSPPAAVLLKKAAKIATASAKPNVDKVGKVTKAQIREIAKIKEKDLNATNPEAVCRIIEGTARSMGIEIVG